jgi:hypothetical protein
MPDGLLIASQWIMENVKSDAGNPPLGVIILNFIELKRPWYRRLF